MIDVVSATRFYQDDGDKIKQNWFLYEYANILFAIIEKDAKLKSYRKKNTRENIIAFCVYFSKRLRQSIFEAQYQQSEGVELNARYIYEFYPDHSRTEAQKLLEAAGRAWGDHVQACMACPNQCLLRGYDRTDAFDNLAETGWPTR